MRSPKQQVRLDITDNLVNLAITKEMTFTAAWKLALWLATEVNRIIFADSSHGLVVEYASAYLLGIDWIELAQEYVDDSPGLIKGIPK